jgi:hypothetical protein
LTVRLKEPMRKLVTRYLVLASNQSAKTTVLVLSGPEPPVKDRVSRRSLPERAKSWLHR